MITMTTIHMLDTMIIHTNNKMDKAKEHIITGKDMVMKLMIIPTNMEVKMIT